MTDHGEIDPGAAREKAGAARLSVATASGLALLKGGAFLCTGSVALLASAVDSLMDIFASVVNFAAIRVADTPADACHRYGHGKAEAIAGLFQCLVIGASVLWLVYESALRLQRPVAIGRPLLGVGVMVISLVASLLLVRRLRSVARKHGSLALQADSLHYLSDVLGNAGVLLALALYQLLGLRWLDPLMALAVCVILFLSVRRVLGDSLDDLMDRQLPAEEHERISQVLVLLDGSRGFHDLRTRRSGSRRFVEVHLQIDRELTFARAHEIAEAAQRCIEKALPGCRAIVHADPWPSSDETGGRG